MAPPPPHLTLDNFNIESEVPENCPFVLTSPRSLEACRRAGVQPVSLLPSTLKEYEEALPDLPRERVLAIFRELETSKEGKLATCREIRKQIVWEEEGGSIGRKEKIGIRRKLSCLSPIVEHVGGRESVLSTSFVERSPKEESPEEERPARTHPQLLEATVSPPDTPASHESVLLEGAVDVSDQPESDQHVPLPITLECEQSGSVNDVFDLANSLSCDSFDSDLLDSDLVFSETPSPLGFTYENISLSKEKSRSCPELERDAEFSEYMLENKLDYVQIESMDKKSSRPAPTFSALDVSCRPLAQPYRKTSSHSKKKASRSERLTSESLQSLYDASEATPNNEDTCLENDCPESERFCASNGCNIDRIGCSLPLSPVSPGSSRNPWPHNKSLASVCPGTSSLVRRALSRSEIDIDQLQISQQDLRILEILANRNNEEQARKHKQQKLRIQWEEEKCKRELEKNELEKEYRKQLTAKRRKENDECHKRLQQARDQFIQSQEYLRQLLKEKDDRKKKLLDTIVKQKEALIREHREQEESKRMAVDNAVRDLLNRDTQYRNELKNQVEEKMERAEKNKKLREKHKHINIIESNRLEIKAHQLRVKKLEEIYEDHIEQIKRVIEKKIKQASEILEKQKESQKMHSGKYSASYAKTLALKAELESGLDLWRKQVLSVQSQSIRRAEERVRKELESRREKLAEEIRTRELKCLEKRREQEEEKKLRVNNTKKKIEEKEKKVERLLSEREKTIIRARKMAENSAKLRELIKTVNV